MISKLPGPCQTESLTSILDADKIQDALLKLTGGRSVPRGKWLISRIYCQYSIDQSYLFYNQLYDLKTLIESNSVFINGTFYGGGDETAAGARNGTLQKLLANWFSHFFVLDVAWPIRA